VQASFRVRTAPGLAVARRVGNAYTASLWLALAAAAESGSYLPGASVGMYSYGSGYCAEFFGGLLLRSGPGAVPSLGKLAERTEIDVATYERWMAARLEPGLPELPVSTYAPFVHVGSRERKRVYERLALGV
jgi:hydroxymethylglutaryl-CoA synthase